MNAHLVVSNPPHGAVDTRRAAEVMEVTAADVGLKANHPVPEIWAVRPEAAAAEAAAGALRSAGLHVVVAPADALREIPTPVLVTTFTFEEHALRAIASGVAMDMTFAIPVIVVFCRPRAGGDDAPAARPSGRYSRPSLAGAPVPAGDDPPTVFVDLYQRAGGVTRQMRFAAGSITFDGLPGETAAGDVASLTALCAELEQRFRTATVDRRLVNMRVRSRMKAAAPGTDPGRRKGYSYGTQNLWNLLNDLSPPLTALSDAELASGLAYLTRRPDLSRGPAAS